ncbi:hypothetical protein BT93_H1714 [Corymbia citriodora subsp. variegata]|nr:hypothetical protein BT93_H1714 [Corymbia citriodora subsp. variegata]
MRRSSNVGSGANSVATSFLSCLPSPLLRHDEHRPPSKRKNRSHRLRPSSFRMSAMKFCCECNNILYPKEDKEQKILLFACRNCEHQEVADNYCVYRNEIHHSVGERTQVLQDVAADPTLPRTKSVRCAQCNHGEAVFFQATARGEEGMTLFFVCCNPNCGYRWRD